jgi:hypothetical protein
MYTRPSSSSIPEKGRVAPNWLILLLAVVLAGLGYLGHVHPISMTPDNAAIRLGESLAPVQRKVGYFIAPALRDLVVMTAGGGGENVCYYPYRDLAPGLYNVLSTVFIGATQVADPKDIAALKKAGISLLVIPEITTSSSSGHVMAWPPTEFDIKLKLTITDLNGNVLETLHAAGRGRAGLQEFNHNHSLSAVRAANDLMIEMHEVLRFSKAAQLPAARTAPV